MTKPAVSSKLDAEMRPAPINPDWIREGQPKARNAVLSQSADGTATTILWDCSAGRFQWTYSFDETIYFLEGSVTIDDGHAGPRHYGPGDVIFFPAGSQALWHVDTYIRKLAFCRRILPAPVGSLIGILRTVKRKLSPPAAGESLLSSG